MPCERSEKENRKINRRIFDKLLYVCRHNQLFSTSDFLLHHWLRLKLKMIVVCTEYDKDGVQLKNVR